jgi:N-ethylmaleimide reductase
MAVARATAAAIGADRMGVRVSPYGVFNATGAYAGLEAQYLDLARELSALGTAYLHVVDHSAVGAPPVPADFKARLRAAFAGATIAVGGFDGATAEQALREGRADLVAFGRPFIANPDLVARLRAGAALAVPDPASFYTADAHGYTDYPALAA